MDREKLEESMAQEEALRLSVGVLAEVLVENYKWTWKQEAFGSSEWAEHKELLTEKAWAMEKQMEVLEIEVKELHKKLQTLETRKRERHSRFQKVLRQELIKFYMEHNAGKLESVDALLGHFKFREKELIEKILERYGVGLCKETLEREGVVDGKDILVSDLETKIEKLWEEIGHVEELAVRSKEEMENVRRELHFPRAEGWRFKHGVDGVYFGMHDFWVESLSATLSMSVLDRCSTPRVLVDVGLSRVADGRLKSKVPAVGAVISFQLNQCGLIGEKGTKVPSLRPKLLKLLVDFSLTIPIEYRNGWRTTKGIQLRIHRIEREFKGTLAIPKSLLRMVLNRVLPGVLKTAILKAVPPELGQYLARYYECPSQKDKGEGLPMHFDLDLNLFGNPNSLSSLNCDISVDSADGAAIRKFLNLSHDQAKTFVKAQKLMHQHVTSLKKSNPAFASWPGETLSASDLVAFVNRFGVNSYSAKLARESAARLHPSRQGSDACSDEARVNWKAILETWQQIVNKVARVDDAAVPDIENLFARVHQLVLKPISCHIEIHNIRLRGSMDHGLEHVRDFLCRATKERHEDSAKRRVHLTKPLAKELEEIQTWYNTAVLPIQYIKQTIRDVSAVVQGHGHAGNFQFSGHDLTFTGPVALSLPFERTMYPPTHFAIDTSISRHEGSFDIGLVLADHLNRSDKLQGHMLRISLKEVRTGIYFDVKSFVVDRALQFKNEEFGAIDASVPLKTSGRSRDLARHRSRSEPNLHQARRKEEEQREELGDVQGGEPLAPFDIVEDTTVQKDEKDGPQGELNAEALSAGIQRKRFSSSLGSEATAVTKTESEMSFSSSESEDEEGRQDEEREDGENEEEEEEDVDESDPRLAASFLANSSFSKPKGAPQDDKMLERMIGQREQAVYSQIRKDFGEEGLEEHLESSLNRFLHHFLNEISQSGDEQGLPVLEAQFDQHTEDSDKFLFNVSTNKMTTMKATAKRLEVSGQVSDIYHYVTGWVQHLIELETKRHVEEVTPSVPNPDVLYQPVRVYANTLAKYFGHGSMKFGFSLRLNGAVRKDVLVASLVETSRRRTSVVRDTEDASVPRSGVLVDTELNLFELIHDIRCLLSGKDPKEVDPANVV